MPHTANTAALGGENGSPAQSKQAFATSLTPSRNVFPPHLCTAMCTAVLLWGIFPGQLHLYSALFAQLHTQTDSVCPCFTLSSTVTESKPSRSLTSPSLSYLRPLQL